MTAHRVSRGQGVWEGRGSGVAVDKETMVGPRVANVSRSAEEVRWVQVRVLRVRLALVLGVTRVLSPSRGRG